MIHHKVRNGKGIFACSWLMLALVMLKVPSVEAAVFDPTFRTPVTHLQVPLSHSRILVLDHPVENVSIGNPEVADIQVLEAKKIYVLGKSLGSTNVMLWGNGGGQRSYTTFSIEVAHDLDALKRTLYEVMPEEKPEVRSSQGSIILGGVISSPAKVEAIAKLAQQFVKSAKKFEAKGADDKQDKGPDTEVINLMQVGGPHQVMLEVKVAEISRSVLKRLGVNMAAFRPGTPWHVGAVNGGASFPNALTASGQEVPIFPRGEPWTSGNMPLTGPPIDKFQPTDPAISATGLFFNYLTGGSYFQLIIDASKEDGLAKILAEPTLTSLSGEPAAFLSGGEFPIPVWTGNNNGISVVFKEFGISVKMLPIVLDSKRINLTLDVSVSELTNAASVTSGVPSASASFSIPSLAKRSTNSTVELMDGETIGVAGLISDKMREAVTKFPGLGDVPVLGALFRSQDYIQDRTELVMFVTAHLAKPIDKSRIRLPTDAFVAPSDAEFFLLGRMEGRKRDDETREGDQDREGVSAGVSESALPANQPNGANGPTFGHQL